METSTPSSENKRTAHKDVLDNKHQNSAPMLSDEEIEKMALDYIATRKEPKSEADRVKKVANDILNGNHFYR